MPLGPAGIRVDPAWPKYTSLVFLPEQILTQIHRRDKRRENTRKTVSSRQPRLKAVVRSPINTENPFLPKKNLPFVKTDFKLNKRKAESKWSASIIAFH